MKITLICCLTIPFFMHLSAWAKDPYVDISSTMCVEGEDVYISCAFNPDMDQYDYIGEVASICARSNTSPDNGYVQYRYGIPSYGLGPANVEMQFPEQKTPPKGIFAIYSSKNPDSTGTALRFKKGEYLYSFERLNSFSYNVVSRKYGKKIFNKGCNLPGKDYLIDDAYKGIQAIELGETKVPGANNCRGIGLREAYSSFDVDKVNACIVYTKSDVQTEGQLSRDPDGISLYSVVSSDTPKLVYEFPYDGTEGKIIDAFFLPVGRGEEMLFVIHHIVAPDSWSRVRDIYDVSVFRVGADSLFLDKKLTRFFHLGGDEIDRQGRVPYIYPYKDKSSVEKAAGSPLFRAIIADKEIPGTVLEKNVLYDGGSEPLLQYSPKMYLIKGDKILVQDSWAGWCKISYQAKVKIVDKWMECKSINFSAR